MAYRRKKDKFVKGNVEVDVREYKSFEQAVRAFTDQVKESGILEEYIEKSRYMKPSDKKRKKSALAKYRRSKNKK